MQFVFIIYSFLPTVCRARLDNRLAKYGFQAFSTYIQNEETVLLLVTGDRSSVDDFLEDLDFHRRCFIDYIVEDDIDFV